MSSDTTFVQKLRAKIGELSDFLAGEVRAAADDAAEDAAALAAADLAEAERAAAAAKGEDTVGAPWIVLARVEGEDSIIPKKDRLTADDLRAMAESYDPAHRRAPIVLTHKGEQSLGHVDEVDFDGVNLLGRVSQIADGGQGLVDAAVSRGWIERSIRFWRNSPELEGRPPYLIHVALLSGEAPGQHSLPPLTEAFSRSLPEAEIFCDRSLLDEPDTEQEIPMDKNELATLVGDAVRSAVEPLENRIKLAEDRAAAAETSAAALAEENRKAALEGELRQLVTEGKVMPAEKESELDMLLALPADKATKRLGDLRSRSRMIRSAETKMVAQDGTVLASDRRFNSELGVNVDPDKLQLVQEAERAAAGDFEKFRAETYARYGEPLSAIPSPN